MVGDAVQCVVAATILEPTRSGKRRLVDSCDRRVFAGRLQLSEKNWRGDFASGRDGGSDPAYALSSDFRDFSCRFWWNAAVGVEGIFASEEQDKGNRNHRRRSCANSCGVAFERPRNSAAIR